jgi:glycerol transport system ATP-binding protein
MNFIPASLTDGNAEFAQLNIPIEPSIYDAALALDTTEIKLGIRPEFVQLHEHFEAGRFRASLTNIDNLGAYSIATLDLAGYTIKARIEEDDWQPCGDTFVSFPDEWLKIYADEHLVSVV